MPTLSPAWHHISPITKEEEEEEEEEEDDDDEEEEQDEGSLSMWFAVSEMQVVYDQEVVG